MNRLEEELMFYNQSIANMEHYLENKKNIPYERWFFIHAFIDGLKKGRSEILQQLKRECE